MGFPAYDSEAPPSPWRYEQFRFEPFAVVAWYLRQQQDAVYGGGASWETVNGEGASRETDDVPTETLVVHGRGKPIGGSTPLLGSLARRIRLGKFEGWIQPVKVVDWIRIVRQILLGTLRLFEGWIRLVRVGDWIRRERSIELGTLRVLVARQDRGKWRVLEGWIQLLARRDKGRLRVIEDWMQLGRVADLIRIERSLVSPYRRQESRLVLVA